MRAIYKNTMSDGDFIYSKNENDDSVTIVDYKNITKTEIVIPETFNSKPVTHIDSIAFFRCKYLKSITISCSVKKIYRLTFDNCPLLENINVDNKNKYYSSKNGVLFNKDGSILVAFPRGKKGEYAVPNKVKCLDDFSFMNCQKLTKIIIPNSVVSIGCWAFRGCDGLTSITIPDSVTRLETGILANCKNLNNIKISNNINKIGTNVFVISNKLKTKEKNYKAFHFSTNRLQCRNYTFKENEWSKTEDSIMLCMQGYHFCTNLFNIFDYYSGEIDNDIVIYECEVGDEIIKNIADSKGDSKCVTNRIKPVKKLSRLDIIKILNGEDYD